MGLISTALEAAATIGAKARDAGECTGNVTSGPGPNPPTTFGGGGGSFFGNGGGGPSQVQARSNYREWLEHIWNVLDKVHEGLGKLAAKRHFRWPKFPSGGMGVDVGIKILETTPKVAKAERTAQDREDLAESLTQRSDDPLASSTEAYEKEVERQRQERREKFLKQQAEKNGGDQ